MFGAQKIQDFDVSNLLRIEYRRIQDVHRPIEVVFKALCGAKGFVQSLNSKLRFRLRSNRAFQNSNTHLKFRVKIALF